MLPLIPLQAIGFARLLAQAQEIDILSGFSGSDLKGNDFFQAKLLLV